MNVARNGTLSLDRRRSNSRRFSAVSKAFTGLGSFDSSFSRACVVGPSPDMPEPPEPAEVPHSVGRETGTATRRDSCHRNERACGGRSGYMSWIRSSCSTTGRRELGSNERHPRRYGSRPTQNRACPALPLSLSAAPPLQSAPCRSQSSNLRRLPWENLGARGAFRPGARPASTMFLLVGFDFLHAL